VTGESAVTTQKEMSKDETQASNISLSQKEPAEEPKEV